MFRITILAILSMVLVEVGVGQGATYVAKHAFARPVIVDITQQWMDTGVNLAAGDTVEIIVKGIASTQGGVGGDRGTLTWLGPEGDGTAVAPASFHVPGVAPHSVIGRVGTSSQGFYVGAERVVRASVAGRLYLGYNDDPTRSWPENFGYYVAFVITRFPIPTSAPQESSVPRLIDVSQNYPNPFNPSTNVNFSLPARSGVTITIYNSVGQMVRTLLDEQRDAGEYTMTWDGRNDSMSAVSSGAYFYQVKIGSFVQTKKMLLLK